MNVYHLDFETRSRVDLKKYGAFRYGSDPSTRILIFAIARGNEEPLLWDCVRGGSMAAAMLRTAVEDPNGLIYAHNAPFEVALSMYRMLKDLNLTPPALTKWRCTSAMARKAALPPSLAKAAEALKQGQQKWGEGYQLIKLFSIPQKDTDLFIEPHTQMEKFKRFCEYCIQDVRAERDVHTALAPFELRGTSLATFQFDLRLNCRGLPVNIDALSRAQLVIDAIQRDVTKEFQELTGLNPTQRDKVKSLLETLGVKLVNMRASTLDDAITGYHDDDEDDDDDLDAETPPEDPRAFRILQLYKLVSFSAVKKVKAMLGSACSDGFIRGMLMYYGTHTGRWAGKIINPQNFKRPTVKGAKYAYELLCAGFGRDELDILFENPLEAIASCIRNFIHDITGPMFDADYSAIEARIVCWLAGQEDKLNDYRNGIDAYKKMAASIFGKLFTKVTDDERWLGKQAVLACGFGLGHRKFYTQTVAAAKTFHITGLKLTPQLSEQAVGTFRADYDKVQSLWYAVDDACRAAINAPGTVHKAGKYLSFTVRTLTNARIPYLIATLPSGRSIVYPYPKIEMLEGDDREGITYWGQLPNSKRWDRIRTYGAAIVGHCTQGTAADIMAHGATNAEAKGFTIHSLIHDQALARAVGKLEDFAAAMTELPAWAAGLPLKVEAKLAPYYSK